MPAAARAYPNNLPNALSSFIGRGREIEALKRLMGTTRLLTLTGPGGCGKTRLGLWVAGELGAEFSDGVWLVELAPLADPGLVPQAVASALGVREAATRSMTAALIEYLAGRETLLFLDNCEHLVAACAELAERLLRACRGVRILATSREALSLPGETVWSVPALSVPEAQQAEAGELSLPGLMQFEAIRLFVERAAAAAPAFGLGEHNARAVTQVCQQLDGLPLAIELAAARVRALPVDQIADRLANHERFRLLTTGRRTSLPHQQTLAATLDWSHSLLTEAEQRVFRRLAVFAGGCTLDAAEAVCGGPKAEGVLEALSRLVDKSLVTVSKGEHETRYGLLEVIRQYAQEKLAASGEADEIHDQHLNYFAAWADNAYPQLDTAQQIEWVRRFEAEHDNLRTALDWSKTNPATAQPGLRLAAGVARFWRLRGYLSEGRTHLTAALAWARAHVPVEPATVGRAELSLGMLAYLQSDYPAAREHLQNSLKVYRSLGPDSHTGAAHALEMLAEVATEEGDYVTAPELFAEALALYRGAGDRRGIADVSMQLGWCGLRTGDYGEANRHLREALALFRELGDLVFIAFGLSGLGEAALRTGQYERAQTLLEESLAIRRRLGQRWGMGTSLGTLGWLALRQGRMDEMRDYMAESLAIRVEIGDKGGIAWCLEKLAEAASQQAGSGQTDLQRAVRVFGAAAALRAPVGSVIDPADQPDYERRLAVLRAALGAEAFEAAWAEGSAESLEQAVAEALAGLERPATAGTKEAYGGLSAREREVASLIAQGKSNREIAEALVVGTRTAETYVSRILNKLGLSSRVQIATWVMEQGLAPPAEDA
jgi:non-specific serine/threonine protein kinase